MIHQKMLINQAEIIKETVLEENLSLKVEADLVETEAETKSEEEENLAGFLLVLKNLEEEIEVNLLFS